MRPSVVRAIRGVLAGVACLSFVAVFFLGQVRGPTLISFIAVTAIGFACLAAAAGPSAVLKLVGARNVDADAPDSDWWLARVEPVLEDAWNRWSDAVLVVGLGALGVGSFVLLAVHPTDEPPIGLLIVGFLGLNGALICLAFAVR
ncbi:hypothetical protein [Halorussus litoreus]|uniref:hypothetical protein n=1 Tax=Halorussus litoreus TaxID=1710536 RepID=UPI000E271EA7|nr:hypothetical protein [Halorussus litoreus]